MSRSARSGRSCCSSTARRSAPTGRFRCICSKRAAIPTPPRWRRWCCCSARGACSTRWPTRSPRCGSASSIRGTGTLLDQLKNTTAQLARLALRASDPARVDERQHAIRSLEAQQGAPRGRAQRAQRRVPRAGAAGHAGGRPGGDPRRRGAAGVRDLSPVRSEGRAERRGVRAAALCGLRRPQARWRRAASISVRPRVIDEAIDALRQALRDPRRADVKARARAVDELVMRSAARGVRRREPLAHFSGRRAESRAVRSAGGRTRRAS